MTNNKILRQSLEQLDGESWGEADFDSSVIQECYRLRRVPLGQLTPKDLRLLLGQQIGLPHLVPLALETLEHEPLLEAEFYPGDLLNTLVGVELEFWRAHPDLLRQALAIVERLGQGSIVLDVENPEAMRALKHRTARLSELTR